MSNWNEGYTRKKQKQMLRDAVEKERQAKLNKPKHYYGDPQYGVSSSHRLEARRKEKFAWRVGFCIIAIISALGIYGLWWAATL